MGPQGNPGLSGATIRDWKIDRARCVAIPVMSDGSEGPRLELRYRGAAGGLQVADQFKPARPSGLLA